MSNHLFPAVIVKQWLEDNLGIPKQSNGTHGLQYSYNEFLVDDSKRRLCVNVEEGTRTGLWIGYKSGEKGDFVQLVADYRSISRKAAFDEIASAFSGMLDPATILRKNKTKPLEKKVTGKVEMPDKLYRIKANDEFSRPYIDMLTRRGMSMDFVEKCYYSFARKYMDRPFVFKNYVIIPYRDKFDNIVYWTARALGNIEPKYFNCPMGDASSYVWNSDTSASEVILCEGIFDAESFEACGIAAGGKNLSDEQLKVILSKKFSFILIGGNNEVFKKGPAKMIDTFNRLRKHGQNTAIFDWPAFAEAKRIKAKDFNEAKPKNRKFVLDDVKKYLITTAEEAEVKYRVNRSYR